jgi:hypothetical protein
MYSNASLGQVAVSHTAGKTYFNFGAWSSEVASRRNNEARYRLSPSPRVATALSLWWQTKRRAGD